MTNQWYFRRIRRLFSDIQGAASRILPTNRLAVSEFVHGWSLSFVEDIMSGLRDVEEFDEVDWEYDILFARFKDYVLEEEAKLEKTLGTVNYFLDDENTLALVAGHDRPEKVGSTSH